MWFALLKNPLTKIIAEKTFGAIKHKLEKDKIVRQKELDHVANTDVQSLKSSESSLKDEYLVIVFSLIFLAHFIPSLQEAGNALGPLQITSAYRCPEHNNKVSSTGLAGAHTTGKAIDIHVSNSAQRKQLIDYFTNKVTGLGIAKTFIHIDIITTDELSHRPNCWLY